MVGEVWQQHPATAAVEVPPVDLLLSLGELEAEVLEVRMHEELVAAPPPRGVLVQAAECEVHPLIAQVLGQLVLQGLYGSGVGDAQSTEKLVGLNTIDLITVR